MTQKWIWIPAAATGADNMESMDWVDRIPGDVQAFILGLVQGLTEFLPVSSSAHLVFTQAIFGKGFVFQENVLAFDLVLHMATLIPVVYFYRDTLRQIFAELARILLRQNLAENEKFLDSEDRRLFLYVCIGTFCTGLVAFPLKGFLEALFHDVASVSIALLITGGLLFVSSFFGAKDNKFELKHAILIGFAQGFAATPGISRSGTTIAIALMLGLSKDRAARFSFLLSIPAILGAAVLTLKDVETWYVNFSALIVGFVAAAFSGYFAIAFLIRLLKTKSLRPFAYYVWPVGVLGYLFSTNVI